MLLAAGGSKGPGNGEDDALLACQHLIVTTLPMVLAEVRQRRVGEVRSWEGGDKSKHQQQTTMVLIRTSEELLGGESVDLAILPDRQLEVLGHRLTSSNL